MSFHITKILWHLWRALQYAEYKLMKLEVVFLPIFPVHQSSWLKFVQWRTELDGEFRVYLHPFSVQLELEDVV